ncbi:MAG: hypothetical protein WAV85_05810 [Rhodoferax sp.]
MVVTLEVKRDEACMPALTLLHEKVGQATRRGAAPEKTGQPITRCKHHPLTNRAKAKVSRSLRSGAVAPADVACAVATFWARTLASLPF